MPLNQREKRSARIVFGIAGFRLRRLSGPSSPRKGHAEEADKREIEQSLAFIAAQQEREKAFQSGESARDKLFTQKNGKRSQDFAAFLLRWKAHLQEVHERALAAAREEESKRVKELARKMVVVHGEFLNLIAASKDLLVRDEWKRERKFSEITNERHGV